MGKRRTKRQKIQAKHQFTLSWNSGSSKANPVISVKGQSKKRITGSAPHKKTAKKADFMDKDINTARIKKGIIKSVILASLILGIEAMIYLSIGAR